ncbi:tetratricopeptide repeat protein [Candidatus Pacearchaeota archaeon]|nr:tetratricopeptide repeat protein [Candidatus Pacearchaeota archaeon]
MKKRMASACLYAFLPCFLLADNLTHGSAVPLANKEIREEFRQKSSINEALFNSALKSFEDGNLNTAISIFELLIFSDPRNPEYYDCLGVLYRAIGENEKAKANFREAISLKPELLSFYKKESLDSAAKGDYSKAVFCLELVVEKEQNNPVHHNLLGMLYYAQERLDESIMELSKAVESDKSFAQAYFNLGFVNYMNYFKTDDKNFLVKAIASLTKSDELEANDEAIELAKSAYELLYNARFDYAR